MDNQELVLLCVIILILLIVILHFLVKLASWALRRKYGVKLKIGGYGMMCFQNIELQLRNGLKLETEVAGISSWIFNSNLKSLVTFYIHDIRLQGDAEWLVSRKSGLENSSENKTAFDLVKYMPFFKFVSLQITNASVMQLGKSDEEFLLHLSFQEFNLYFSHIQDSAQLNVGIQSSSIKVFKHLSMNKEENNSTEACICHFSSNLKISLDVGIKNGIHIQSVGIHIADPELMLYEGFSVIKFKNYALNTNNQTYDEEDFDNEEMEHSEELNLPKLFLKVPKVTHVSIDSFSVKMMMKGGNRIFTCGVQYTALHFEIIDFEHDETLPSVISHIEVREITASSDHIQFGQLKNFYIQLNINKKLVEAKCTLSFLHVFYEKAVLKYFLNALLLSNQKMKLDSEVPTKRKKNLQEFMFGYKLKASADIKDICVSLKIPECETFSFGLCKGQTSFEHFVNSQSLHNVNKKSLQSHSSTSIEILVENMFWKLGDSCFSELGTLKRYHYFNIPVSLGVILMKIRSTPLECCLECMLDNCQLQWCPDSSNLLLYLLKFVRSSFPEYQITKESTQLQPSMLDKPKIVYSLELNFRGLNVFAISPHQNGFVARVDILNATSSQEKLKVTFEGFKTVYHSSFIKAYQCVRSSEIKSYESFIEDASIIYAYKDRNATIQISETMFFVWSSTLHMSLFTILQQCTAFRNDIYNFVKKADTLEKGPYMNRETVRTTEKIAISFQAKGHLDVGVILSKNHRLVFSSTDISVKYVNTVLSANSDQLVIDFDDHEIFTFQSIIVSLMLGSEQHLLTRQSFEDLELSNNRLLAIRFEAVKFAFPYKYNFAESFNEEFMNVVKWAKKLHKTKKNPFTLDSTLPPDLHIVCKAWTIEMEEDPFEVKLRDNFELLEDEYHESLKRRRMLDEKIENLRATNPLFPNEKINLLYSKLSRKSAEIYIQRSQQLYQRGSTRPHLCKWVLEDVDIMAIADTSYHGTERVIHHIGLIEPESPYPEEGLVFTTLWARKVRCSAASWTWQMRDFPQMPLNIRELHLWGFLIGAEQEASQRAKRSSTVEIDEPFTNSTVERSMPPLKFFHDLTFDMEEMSMAYGPSWEPVMAQISLAMEFISRPSLDPSPALPWWDKMRLLYHGRLTIIAKHLNLFLRAALDPYNTTENMEISWSEVFIQWTNGKVLTRGDLDFYVHTASKYDDIRVLHIPHLKLSISLDWLCLGNPFDHHNVMPCAPDKVPEYSINQEHDSYRAYRSQNLNLSITFETRHSNTTTEDVPSMLLYSSTLKWIENLKMILSGVTRLTRRGVLFSNKKPRKPQLSRHYHRLCVSLNLHQFEIIYWMSFAMQRGLKLMGGRLSLSSEQIQSFANVNDGLKHRPRSNWSIGYLNCELSDSEIWLFNCLDEENENPSKSFSKAVERSYFLSVHRVSYGREEIVKNVMSEEDKADIPTHRLVVHGLKGAWTRHNRLVIFSLFDSYQKSVVLKKNLSTEALRCFKVESQNTPQKIRSQTNASLNTPTSIPSPMTNLQSSHAATMLQKLVAESEANPMVFIEEMEGTTREQQLYGVAACQTDDVLQKKWLIELVNSQVMLRGTETSGYVIVSAAKAKILQRLHSPVWKDRSLVSKTTWMGSFECMQYYATVDAGAPTPSTDDIMWLSLDNIEERESMVISDLPDLVGSGHSVGGVVSSTVGATSDPESAPLQLQRIVSRCGCQFFYASFGENVDPGSLDEVPPLPEDDLWEQEVAVDCFTLTHHDLDICTNSLQYAMILDLVNNLLLYVEPRKKEATNKMQTMRFQLQLCKVEDQKGPILQLQEKIRSLLSSLRRLEKEAYVTHKLLQESSNREEYIEELDMLDNQIYQHKERLNTMNEELTIMISCFKETQIIASRSRQRASSQEKGVSTSRRSEVCFKHAQWRLTDADGQLGIADLILSNFLYSKVTKSDDSFEHLLELGYMKMNNLLPNQAYKTVLQPTEVQTKIPLDRQCLLRIFCRERAPVGGISVKEHLEVNVVPITIGLTEAFYKAMLKFFFPGRDTDKTDEEEEEPVQPTNKKSKQKQSSRFYKQRDDIEKMKERADKNHTFISIKIPEVPIRVSYKGRKEKNIEDLNELSLVLSTIEYHNNLWTWLDLLMALKNDAKKILLSQAIKQKLLKSKNNPDTDNQPQEDEKAMILLGAQHLGGTDRTLKRGLLNRMKREHR